MALVNDTFSPIENIRKLSLSWINTYSERVKGLFLDKENQEFIQNMLTDDQAGGLLDLLLTNNITRSLNEEGETPLINKEEVIKTFKEYFNGNFSTQWRETFVTLDNVVRNISTYITCFDFNKFVPMPDERALEVEGVRLITENKLWAGLVFENMPPQSHHLPEFIRYKIRTDSDKVDSTYYVEDRRNRPGPRRRPRYDLKYLYFGFAYLQDMLEHSIISLQSGRNKSDLPGVFLQQMPYGCYTEDNFINGVSRSFPLFMTLAWVYSASMIIKSIVYEKERRLKETMRVMGLGNFVHWISWFIDSTAVMSFSSLLLTIILKVLFGNEFNLFRCS